EANPSAELEELDIGAMRLHQFFRRQIRDAPVQFIDQFLRFEIPPSRVKHAEVVRIGSCLKTVTQRMEREIDRQRSALFVLRNLFNQPVERNFVMKMPVDGMQAGRTASRLGRLREHFQRNLHARSQTWIAFRSEAMRKSANCNSADRFPVAERCPLRGQSWS